jgi:hypothetical protein
MTWRSTTAHVVWKASIKSGGTAKKGLVQTLRLALQHQFTDVENLVIQPDGGLGATEEAIDESSRFIPQPAFAS